MTTALLMKLPILMHQHYQDVSQEISRGHQSLLQVSDVNSLAKPSLHQSGDFIWLLISTVLSVMNKRTLRKSSFNSFTMYLLPSDR